MHLTSQVKEEGIVIEELAGPSQVRLNRENIVLGDEEKGRGRGNTSLS